MPGRTEGCLIFGFVIAIAVAIIIVRRLRAGERALQDGVDGAADTVSDLGSHLSK